ncbi:RmlC-like cupin domain-containing protein [Xylariomycetidae sp. FL2044]|nr:RmlC-like cupin domain-containing protein [Xylariomycetidae sp. FL2044]
MFKATAAAAILGFCSYATLAAPAGTAAGSSQTAPTATATATAAYAGDATYAPSVTYVQSAAAISTSAPDTNAGASADAGTGTPDLLAGLSKTQRILLSDARVDAFNDVLQDDKDFVFDFIDKKTGGPGEGGEIVPANRKTFPALTNTGIGMAVGFLGPCGFNTPHIHPRATELLVVIKGEIVSEMVIENGVNNAQKGPRNIINKLTELQMTPYYQGAIHTQFNPSCDATVFIAPQSSEDFGTNTVAQAFFALQDKTIDATFGNQIDGADIDKYRDFLSVNVAKGVEECLAACKIPKRK